MGFAVCTVCGGWPYTQLTLTAELGEGLQVVDGMTVAQVTPEHIGQGEGGGGGGSLRLQLQVGQALQVIFCHHRQSRERRWCLRLGNIQYIIIYLFSHKCKMYNVGQFGLNRALASQWFTSLMYSLL